MTQCEIQITSSSTSGCVKVGEGAGGEVGTGERDHCEFGGSQKQPLVAQPSAWLFWFSIGRALRDHWSTWTSDFGRQGLSFCSPYWLSHPKYFALARFQFPSPAPPLAPQAAKL